MTKKRQRHKQVKNKRKIHLNNIYIQKREKTEAYTETYRETYTTNETATYTDTKTYTEK